MNTKTTKSADGSDKLDELVRLEDTVTNLQNALRRENSLRRGLAEFIENQRALDFCKSCGELTETVAPTGFQLVSDGAIQWLYENHKEVYLGFYERVLPKTI